ncbi:MAG: carbon-phosphorus lyase complex subunit PhnI [Peptococcaceae bacterium]|jgi:alpha-D-ribose 1-methylphosphonate 5-triphosphate synthase subunit PhnI|nr:carbon-phosphorus lyase complex subunit PhnI [Peptococcaceae bacterium]
MAYVAVSGGEAAILASMDLTGLSRRGEPYFDPGLIEGHLKLLLDRVMSEAGLYGPSIAAAALKQCEGSPEEAVFLLRAYRSTLTREYYSRPLSLDNMRVLRRVSAVFKDIPGGQWLGPTYDYTHRLIQEDAPGARSLEKWLGEDVDPGGPAIFPRVVDILREQGLMRASPDPEGDYFDITKRPLLFPCPRSARLQALARGEAGFIIAMAYSFLRGHTVFHPNVGELRCGYVELLIDYPPERRDTWYAGEILLTEVDCFLPREAAGQSPEREKELRVAAGYGISFGRNETKAIAMSILDCTLDMPGDAPCHDSEFVLLSGDTLEMNGFVSHLKLPHYVTFQSKLDRVREGMRREERRPAP